jgi:hypothetical protein
MASFEEEIVTDHFVETASINRPSRKVIRCHNKGCKGIGIPERPAAFPPPAAPRNQANWAPTRPCAA